MGICTRRCWLQSSHGLGFIDSRAGNWRMLHKWLDKISICTGVVVPFDFY